MKKVLMLASVASMIDQFNMQNIAILQEQGYEVHVAANFEQGSTSSKERMEQFKKELKEKNILYFQIDFSRNVANIHQNMKAYKQIKKLLVNNKYEFIHCHSPIGGVCGRLAAKATNTKVIYTAHGFHFYKGAPKLNWMIYYPIEKVLSYITDVLITINQEDYKLAKEKMKSKKIFYIPGIGVDTDKWKGEMDSETKRIEIGISKDSIMLLSVGELNKNKNHEVIIRALKNINRADIHYYIVGKGKLDNYLKGLVSSLNLNERVHFLGFRTDILSICKAADIFCFPSYREGLGIAAIEAMSSGLPLITSNVHGINDYSQNYITGFACNPSSVDEFQTSIETLIENKELRDTMSKYNMKLASKFDVSVVNREMKRIYRDTTLRIKI